MSDSENCALDKNGNLMDASQISFFNSPSDEKPISGPGADPPSPSPASKHHGGSHTRPQRNSNRSKYNEAIAAVTLDSDFDCDDPSPGPAIVKEPSNRKRKKQQLRDSDTDLAQAPSTSQAVRKKATAKKAKTNASHAAHHFVKKPTPSEQQPLTNSSQSQLSPASQTDIPTVGNSESVDKLESPLSSNSSPQPITGNAAKPSTDISISVVVESGERGGKEDVLTVCHELEEANDSQSGKYHCMICE